VEGLGLISESKRQIVSTITAIIPTLNRYDYVQQSIRSLLKQNPPPDEIIVVDQTAEARRRPEVYAPFEGRGFRVIYQDRPGQSTSRNEAIRQATGDWCLLWEDDTEAWDDLLEQHVKAIEYSGADASTGVSLAPWKTVDYIPGAKRHMQIADVFATGNSLVRRSALLEVGGLDNAFNRGSGADHDLGVRLYLSGKEIIYNPRAVETHHKAVTGGMRTYGAWWRNSGTWLSPFPPPTQVYTVRRYYPRAFRLPLYLLHYWTATKKHKSFELFWLWFSTPWKLWRAMRAADKLHTEFGLEQATSIQP
jgi:GT2 family glycosyltransferase